MVEKGCLFFVCISWELAVHAEMVVKADAMGVVVYDELSILIISFIDTVILGGSFGFRRCGISTLFLILIFFAVGFCHQFVYFGYKVLVL